MASYNRYDREYRPKSHSGKPAYGDSNTVLIISVSVLFVLVVVAVIIAFLAINGSKAETETKKQEVTEVTDERDDDESFYEEEEEIVIEDEEPQESEEPRTEKEEEKSDYAEEQTVKYFVRKSWSDADSQKGAFADFDNAVSYADTYAGQGYKVYDSRGNILYTPVQKQPENTGDIKYRVRKSAGDSDSQIGAFAEYANAVDLAKSRKSEGYKVYDMSGNLVYTP